MEITNIIIFLLAASILFEIYLYKNSMKHLKSYKGLSKLTKMVNDINFNKEEKELFIVHIKSSINSSKNSFIFSLFFTLCLKCIFILSLHLLLKSDFIP